MSEIELNIRITTDTPYLALTGELWGAYCEDLGKMDRVITAPHCIMDRYCFLCYVLVPCTIYLLCSYLLIYHRSLPVDVVVHVLYVMTQVLYLYWQSFHVYGDRWAYCMSKKFHSIHGRINLETHFTIAIRFNELYENYHYSFQFV